MIFEILIKNLVIRRLCIDLYKKMKEIPTHNYFLIKQLHYPAKTSKNSNIIYINGMLTIEKYAHEEREEIIRQIGYDVDLFYNPTYNILVKSFVYVLQLYEYETKVEYHLRIHIQDLIIEQSNKKLIFFAHSQGSVLLQNTLNRIGDIIAENMVTIKIILFGPPKVTLIENPYITGQVYYHEYDIFSTKTSNNKFIEVCNAGNVFSHNMRDYLSNCKINKKTIFSFND